MSEPLKFTAHLYWKKPYGGEPMGRDTFHLFTSEGMEEYGYVPVGSVEVETPIPEFDPIKGQLSVIEEQERKARADFALRITELQRMKNELLTIENTVEA